MRILAVWEECDFLHGEWQREKIPSFWVEATDSEVDKVLAHASDAGALREEIARNRTDPNAPFYLLVSQNLESIVTLPSYYPYSGQWYGGSPFRQLEPVEIDDLGEVPKRAAQLMAH